MQGVNVTILLKNSVKSITRRQFFQATVCEVEFQIINQ